MKDNASYKMLLTNPSAAIELKTILSSRSPMFIDNKSFYDEKVDSEKIGEVKNRIAEEQKTISKLLFAHWYSETHFCTISRKGLYQFLDGPIFFRLEAAIAYTAAARGAYVQILGSNVGLIHDKAIQVYERLKFAQQKCAACLDSITNSGRQYDVSEIYREYTEAKTFHIQLENLLTEVERKHWVQQEDGRTSEGFRWVISHSEGLAASLKYGLELLETRLLPRLMIVAHLTEPMLRVNEIKEYDYDRDQKREKALLSLGSKVVNGISSELASREKSHRIRYGGFTETMDEGFYRDFIIWAYQDPVLFINGLLLLFKSHSHMFAKIIQHASLVKAKHSQCDHDPAALMFAFLSDIYKAVALSPFTLPQEWEQQLERMQKDPHWPKLSKPQSAFIQSLMNIQKAKDDLLKIQPGGARRILPLYSLYEKPSKLTGLQQLSCEELESLLRLSLQEYHRQHPSPEGAPDPLKTILCHYFHRIAPPFANGRMLLIDNRCHDEKFITGLLSIDNEAKRKKTLINAMICLCDYAAEQDSEENQLRYIWAHGASSKLAAVAFKSDDFIAIVNAYYKSADPLAIRLSLLPALQQKFLLNSAIKTYNQIRENLGQSKLKLTQLLRSYFVSCCPELKERWSEKITDERLLSILVCDDLGARGQVLYEGSTKLAWAFDYLFKYSMHLSRFAGDAGVVSDFSSKQFKRIVLHQISCRLPFQQQRQMLAYLSANISFEIRESLLPARQWIPSEWLTLPMRRAAAAVSAPASPGLRAKIVRSSAYDQFPKLRLGSEAFSLPGVEAAREAVLEEEKQHQRWVLEPRSMFREFKFQEDPNDLVEQELNRLQKQLMALAPAPIVLTRDVFDQELKSEESPLSRASSAHEMREEKEEERTIELFSFPKKSALPSVSSSVLIEEIEAKRASLISFDKILEQQAQFYAKHHEGLVVRIQRIAGQRYPVQSVELVESKIHHFKMLTLSELAPLFDEIKQEICLLRLEHKAHSLGKQLEALLKRCINERGKSRLINGEPLELLLKKHLDVLCELYQKISSAYELCSQSSKKQVLEDLMTSLQIIVSKEEQDILKLQQGLLVPRVAEIKSTLLPIIMLSQEMGTAYQSAPNVSDLYQMGGEETSVLLEADRELALILDKGSSSLSLLTQSFDAKLQEIKAPVDPSKKNQLLTQLKTAQQALGATYSRLQAELTDARVADVVQALMTTAVENPLDHLSVIINEWQMKILELQVQIEKTEEGALTSENQRKVDQLIHEVTTLNTMINDHILVLTRLYLDLVTFRSEIHSMPQIGMKPQEISKLLSSLFDLEVEIGKQFISSVHCIRLRQKRYIKLSFSPVISRVEAKSEVKSEEGSVEDESPERIAENINESLYQIQLRFIELEQQFTSFSKLKTEPLLTSTSTRIQISTPPKLGAFSKLGQLFSRKKDESKEERKEEKKEISVGSSLSSLSSSVGQVDLIERATRALREKFSDEKTITLSQRIEDLQRLLQSQSSRLLCLLYQQAKKPNQEKVFKLLKEKADHRSSYWNQPLNREDQIFRVSFELLCQDLTFGISLHSLIDLLSQLISQEDNSALRASFLNHLKTFCPDIEFDFSKHPQSFRSIFQIYFSSSVAAKMSTDQIRLFIKNILGALNWSAAYDAIQAVVYQSQEQSDDEVQEGTQLSQHETAAQDIIAIFNAKLQDDSLTIAQALFEIVHNQALWISVIDTITKKDKSLFWLAAGGEGETTQTLRRILQQCVQYSSEPCYLVAPGFSDHDMRYHAFLVHALLHDYLSKSMLDVILALKALLHVSPPVIQLSEETRMQCLRYQEQIMTKVIQMWSQAKDPEAAAGLCADKATAWECFLLAGIDPTFLQKLMSQEEGLRALATVLPSSIHQTLASELKIGLPTSNPKAIQLFYRSFQALQQQTLEEEETFFLESQKLWESSKQLNWDDKQIQSLAEKLQDPHLHLRVHESSERQWANIALLITSAILAHPISEEEITVIDSDDLSLRPRETSLMRLITAFLALVEPPQRPEDLLRCAKQWHLKLPSKDRLSVQEKLRVLQELSLKKQTELAKIFVIEEVVFQLNAHAKSHYRKGLVLIKQCSSVRKLMHFYEAQSLVGPDHYREWSVQEKNLKLILMQKLAYIEEGIHQKMSTRTEILEAAKKMFSPVDESKFSLRISVPLVIPRTSDTISSPSTSPSSVIDEDKEFSSDEEKKPLLGGSPSLSAIDHEKDEKISSSKDAKKTASAVHDTSFKKLLTELRKESICMDHQQQTVTLAALLKADDVAVAIRYVAAKRLLNQKQEIEHEGFNDFLELLRLSVHEQNLLACCLTVDAKIKKKKEELPQPIQDYLKKQRLKRDQFPWLEHFIGEEVKLVEVKPKEKEAESKAEDFDDELLPRPENGLIHFAKTAVAGVRHLSMQIKKRIQRGQSGVSWDIIINEWKQQQQRQQIMRHQMQVYSLKHRWHPIYRDLQVILGTYSHSTPDRKIFIEIVVFAVYGLSLSTTVQAKKDRYLLIKTIIQQSLTELEKPGMADLLASIILEYAQVIRKEKLLSVEGSAEIKLSEVADTISSSVAGNPIPIGGLIAGLRDIHHHASELEFQQEERFVSIVLLKWFETQTVKWARLLQYYWLSLVEQQEDYLKIVKEGDIPWEILANNNAVQYAENIQKSIFFTEINRLLMTLFDFGDGQDASFSKAKASLQQYENDPCYFRLWRIVIYKTLQIMNYPAIEHSFSWLTEASLDSNVGFGRLIIGSIYKTIGKIAAPDAVGYDILCALESSSENRFKKSVAVILRDILMAEVELFQNNASRSERQAAYYGFQLIQATFGTRFHLTAMKYPFVMYSLLNRQSFCELLKIMDLFYEGLSQGFDLLYLDQSHGVTKSKYQYLVSVIPMNYTFLDFIEAIFNFYKEKASVDQRKIIDEILPAYLTNLSSYLMNNVLCGLFRTDGSAYPPEKQVEFLYFFIKQIQHACFAEPLFPPRPLLAAENNFPKSRAGAFFDSIQPLYSEALEARELTHIADLLQPRVLHIPLGSELGFLCQHLLHDLAGLRVELWNEAKPTAQQVTIANILDCAFQLTQKQLSIEYLKSPSAKMREMLSEIKTDGTVKILPRGFAYAIVQNQLHQLYKSIFSIKEESSALSSGRYPADLDKPIFLGLIGMSQPLVSTGFDALVSHGIFPGALRSTLEGLLPKQSLPNEDRLMRQITQLSAAFINLFRRDREDFRMAIHLLLHWWSSELNVTKENYESIALNKQQWIYRMSCAVFSGMGWYSARYEKTKTLLDQISSFWKVWANHPLLSEKYEYLNHVLYREVLRLSKMQESEVEKQGILSSSKWAMFSRSAAPDVRGSTSAGISSAAFISSSMSSSMATNSSSAATTSVMTSRVSTAPIRR